MATGRRALSGLIVGATSEDSKNSILAFHFGFSCELKEWSFSIRMGGGKVLSYVFWAG